MVMISKSECQRETTTKAKNEGIYKTNVRGRISLDCEEENGGDKSNGSLRSLFEVVVPSPRAHFISAKFTSTHPLKFC